MEILNIFQIKTLKEMTVLHTTLKQQSLEMMVQLKLQNQM